MSLLLPLESEQKNQIKKSLKEYVKRNLKTWIEDTVLFEVLSAAHAANMPHSFIAGIKLVGNPESGFEVINTWRGDKGEPLAEWFEYGTADHYIYPKTKLALYWIPKSGSGSTPQFDIVTGNTTLGRFSKGHKVSGIKKYESMTKGYARGLRRLKSYGKQKLSAFGKSLENPEKGIKVKV